MVQIRHQLFSFGDVRCNCDKSVDIARAILHRGHRNMHRQRRAVVANVGPLALVDLTVCCLGRNQVQTVQVGGIVRLRLFGAPGQLAGIVQGGNRDLADEVCALVAGQPLGCRVHYLDYSLQVRLDNAERSILEDRVAEARQTPVALFAGFDLGGIAGADRHAVAKLGHSLAQPKLLAILLGDGVLLGQRLAVQNHLAIAVEHSAGAIGREEHAQALIQQLHPRCLQQRFGVPVHIDETEVHDVAGLGSHRVEDEEGVGAGLGRGDKARIFLISPAIGDPLVPLAPDQQNRSQEGCSPDKDIDYRRREPVTAFAEPGEQQEQRNQPRGHSDQLRASRTLKPAFNQDCLPSSYPTVTETRVTSGTQVAGIAQVRASSKASIREAEWNYSAWGQGYNFRAICTGHKYLSRNGLPLTTRLIRDSVPSLRPGARDRDHGCDPRPSAAP